MDRFINLFFIKNINKKTLNLFYFKLYFKVNFGQFY